MARERLDWEGWQQATVALVRRDSDRCGWCGQPLAGNAERHHRQRRRVGGDALANLVLLHSRCHQDVHSHPLLAQERGFIVPTWGDFETWPIRMKHPLGMRESVLGNQPQDGII